MLSEPPFRRFLIVLVLVTSSLALGCRRRAQVDPHVEEGHRLLQSDPKAALAELEKAQNPADPRALLGRGLALERLRDYGEAEKVLARACAAKSDPTCSLSLGRVRVVLGKLDAAREAIDKVAAQDGAEFSAVLLEAFLAHDDARARRSLTHLQKWSDHAQSAEEPLMVPAEFYLTQVALFRQLKMKTEFDAATEQAKKTRLSQSRGVLGLVELALKAGRPGLAVELLRKIEEDHPSAEVRRQVARLAHGLGDHRLVGDILDTLPGDDVELLTLRAEHDFVTGQPAAIGNLRRALELAQGDTEQTRLRLMLAEASLRSSQLAEARVEAEKVLQSHRSEAALLLLARVDLAEKAPRAALQRLAPLLAGPKPAAAAREVAASAHLALDQREEARVLLDAILQEQPSQAHAARLRVALEVDGGKPAEGLRIARELARRAPEDAGLRFLLADAIGNVEGVPAAARSLQESARALPSNVQLWLAAAARLEETKAGAEALATLEEAHTKLPGEGAVTAALAAKLAPAGQAERAAALYQELLDRAGDSPIALNNLAVIYADDLNDAGRAVALAERAHALSQEPPVKDTLGWALYRRGAPGDLERSLKLLQSVAALLSSPTARYHLGAVLLATGSPSEGRALLTQALAQADDFPGADHARALLKAQTPPPKR